MMPTQDTVAIVLTSGGLDSATVLAIAHAEGFQPLPLTFRYGQTHQMEVERAELLVKQMGWKPHLILDLPFGEVGGSALLGEGEIPTEPGDGAGSQGIPVTYVPARNLVFLAMAIAVAEARNIRHLFLGVNALDYSGYPDCREAFIEALTEAANLGTRSGVESQEPYFQLHTPLMAMGKAEIIRRGVELGVDYSVTLSCYNPDPEGRACGRCDSCGLRRRGFLEAGVPDPTQYQSAP